MTRQTTPSSLPFRRLRRRLRHRLACGASALLLAALAPQAANAASLDIPAQPLADALMAFGRQADVQILFSQDMVRGLRAPRLNGEMSVREGLAALLAGSGLTFDMDGGSIVLTRPGGAGDGDGDGDGAVVLDPVRVAGSGGETATGPVHGYVARRSATATKTDTPLIEVPQSISVITPEQLEHRNVHEESEAFLYSAGVFSQAFGGKVSPYNNFYYIRGFPTSFGGNTVDGLSNAVNYSYEPYAFERIEVLRGPASVLYGQSDPGGLVNRVSKRPTAEPVREAEIEVGTYDWKQASVDLGGAANEDGTILVRLTALGRDAHMPVDFAHGQDVEDDRLFVAPAVTFNFTPDTTLTLLGSRLETQAHSVMAFIRQGYEVSDIRIDQDRGTFFDYEDTSLGYVFDHRFANGLAIGQTLKTKRMDYGYVSLAQANVIDAPLPGGRIVPRSAFGFDERREDVLVDTRATKTFSFGGMEHTVLAGFDYQWLQDRYSFLWGPAPSLDLRAPDYDQPFAAPAPYMTVNAESHNKGLYLQEQAKIADRWVITLGLRHDWAETTSEDLLAGGTLTEKNDATTGRAGLTYLFDNGVAPYVSYAESFLPTSGSTAGGAAFEPTEGRQIEAGVKYQPATFPATFTAAVYQLTKQNVTTPDPLVPGASVQTGEIRSRGLELEATAEWTPGLKTQAAYTFTDAEITRSNNGNEGDTPQRAPRHMASLWVDYALPAAVADGLSVGGGVRYVGRSYAWDATLALPQRYENDAYTLADMALRYDLGAASPTLEGATAALNIGNLFGTDYQTCYTRWDCQAGTPRTAVASLTYRW